MKKSLVFVLLLAACGDIASTDSTTSNTQDNSVDNSQHGISSCTRGSTFVCTEAGPGQFVQTEECKNVNGEVVVLSGPEPIDGHLADACPTPEPIEVPVE